ncbi:MAG: hypothetical protein ACXVPU_00915 [Bacteroidia bacterium]
MQDKNKKKQVVGLSSYLRFEFVSLKNIYKDKYYEYSIMGDTKPSLSIFLYVRFWEGQ